MKSSVKFDTVHPPMRKILGRSDGRAKVWQQKPRKRRPSAKTLGALGINGILKVHIDELLSSASANSYNGPKPRLTPRHPLAMSHLGPMTGWAWMKEIRASV